MLYNLKSGLVFSVVGTSSSDWSEWSACKNDSNTGALYVERQRSCNGTVNVTVCQEANANGVVFERQNVTCANITCVGKRLILSREGIFTLLLFFEEVLESLFCKTS